MHHHRCNPDTLTIEQATELAADTWGDREPWAHLSSPIMAWTMEGDHRPHADYIDPDDFPAYWLGRRMTVDIEAKAKELAVLRLDRQVRRMESAATRTNQAAAATPCSSAGQLTPPAGAR